MKNRIRLEFDCLEGMCLASGLSISSMLLEGLSTGLNEISTDTSNLRMASSEEQPESPSVFGRLPVSNEPTVQCSNADTFTLAIQDDRADLLNLFASQAPVFVHDLMSLANTQPLFSAQNPKSGTHSAPDDAHDAHGGGAAEAVVVQKSSLRTLGDSNYYMEFTEGESTGTWDPLVTLFDVLMEEQTPAPADPDPDDSPGFYPDPGEVDPLYLNSGTAAPLSDPTIYSPLERFSS